METTDKKSALSPEEWLRIIEECKASDLPVTEYCAQTGVGVSHYYRWRRRLHGKNAQSKGSKGVGMFRELSAIPVKRAAPATATAPVWAVELELLSGVTIRVRG